MSSNELSIVAEQIARALTPEHIFGVLSGAPDAQLDAARKIYWRLARVVHEDKYLDVGEKAQARKAFQGLTELWGRAQAALKAGSYGTSATPKKAPTRGPLVFRTARYSYQVLTRISEGGTCGIFTGVAIDKQGVATSVVMRIPHSSADNDLMEREARSYGLIASKVKELSNVPDRKRVAVSLAGRLPHFLESIRLAEPGSTHRRVVNVLLQDPVRTDGWYTLEAIRSAYPNGVSTRIMTFIWNRILEGLTLAHSAKVIHGGLTPNHVLVHARDHQANIIDWTASCRLGQADVVPYMESRYQAYYPLEVACTAAPPTPASDIFMSAWCMVYLLGGDPATQHLPDTVEAPFREFINRCLQPTASRRPRDGSTAWGEFTEVAKRVFPVRQFAPLDMPSSVH